MTTAWEARIDLAAAFRLAARFGFEEGVCNHFSYALPDEDGGEDPGLFLLDPHDIHWSQMRASDLLLVDDDGKIVEGEGELETTAFCIHAAVHRAHPRARCVLHTHMPYATTLTTLEDPRLLPISQNALRFWDEVAYDMEYGGLADDEAEGARIAECLGEKRVLFMGNHGVMVVGETIHQAFDDLYYLERACELQVLAWSTGKPLREVGDNQAGATKRQFDRQHAGYAHSHFQALKRLLDEGSPDYAG